MNTRREFLVMAGAAVVAPLIGVSTRVPKMLDHILLGCNDLERGIAFVEERTGVKAAFGGVHPGRGTQNALLSLGERHYLEIIAPDPKQAGTAGPQSSVARLGLRELAEPRLVTWAAHPGSVAALAEKLKKAGVAAEGPTPGSRKRPDGRLLEWKTVNLADDVGGLLPFFIEWGADSVHPSVDAPKGCELVSFEAMSPKPEVLRTQFRAVEIEISVQQGEKEMLRAKIRGPKGTMELSG
jgi:catechol 2,3-dioxygenase-like lactoylglutathione lyase family enzyme